MLRELHIKNVAVIEEVTVEFENGFQTLTVKPAQENQYLSIR